MVTTRNIGMIADFFSTNNISHDTEKILPLQRQCKMSTLLTKNVKISIQTSHFEKDLDLGTLK